MSESTETTVRRLLGNIAPEMELDRVPANADLRVEIEIDSMDILHFAVALAEELKIDIPERDYGQLFTIASCVDYVNRRRAEAGEREPAST